MRVTTTALLGASTQPGGVWSPADLADPADIVGIERYEYVLVTDEAAWRSASAAGLDPVIAHLRFSVTSARSGVVALLGRLMMPWRWRRILLNAGIDEVEYDAGAPLAPLVGAVLAGSRVRRSRRAGR